MKPFMSASVAALVLFIGLLLSLSATADTVSVARLFTLLPPDTLTLTRSPVHDGMRPIRYHSAELHRLPPGSLVRVPLSDVLEISLTYDYTIESPSGSRTWVGRLTGFPASYRAVITDDGEHVHGRIMTPRGVYWLETSEDGTQWLHNPRASGLMPTPFGDDAIVPPYDLLDLDTVPPTRQAPSLPDPRSTEQAVVDLLIAYTPGLAAEHGSGLVARLDQLIAVANQAYTDSGIYMRLNLVHSVEVQYSDALSNHQALDDITPQLSTPPAVALLADLRDQYGADLVTLIRPYDRVQHGGCGVAWLLGVGRGELSLEWDAPYGYSVVSDGSSGSFFCADTTLAHELGHNMGSDHDRATATVQGSSGGVFDYSYGHGIEGMFGTIMSYIDPEVALFSGRAISCAPGQPCGVNHTAVNSADNVRSINNVRFQVAAFRERVPTDPVTWLSNNQAVTGLSGAQGSERLFRIDVPTGATELRVTLTPDAVGSAAADNRLSTRIVGGTNADIRDYPWQVALLNRFGDPFCGGSIIARQWVLTAAHCFPETQISIRAGVTNPTHTTGQEIAVLREIIHPDYDSWTQDSDIALVELAADLDLSGNTAQAIPLMTPALAAEGLTAPGVDAIITGWGATREGGANSPILQQATVPIIANTEASAAYEPLFGPDSVTANMLAAGYLGEGGVDTCQGDSGSPLVVPDASGGYRLAGITSWGEGCARPDYPGVYTRVAQFADWIAAEMGDTHADPSPSSGDADLYVRLGSPPTTWVYDCRSENIGNNETCVLSHPAAGTYYILVYGYEAYAGVTLRAQYATADELPELPTDPIALAIAVSYVGFFDRAPDFNGLEFWTQVAENSGLSDQLLMRQLADGFANHPSFTAIYGQLNSGGFIDAIYRNVGGVLPDAEGRSFWLNELNGGKSRSEFVADFIFGLLNLSEAALEEMVASGALTAEEGEGALQRKRNLTHRAQIALLFVELLEEQTNLDPGTDPLNQASLEADPAYQASVKIISGVTAESVPRDAALAYLVANPSIAAINNASMAEIFGGMR